MVANQKAAPAANREALANKLRPDLMTSLPTTQFLPSVFYTLHFAFCIVYTDRINFVFTLLLYLFLSFYDFWYN